MDPICSSHRVRSGRVMHLGMYHVVSESTHISNIFQADMRRSWREGVTHIWRMGCGTDRMFSNENDPCSGSQTQSPFGLLS